MGFKAAAQVLKKADSLKAKISAKDQDLLNDLQAWTNQQQLQTIYHQVLVLDLEYALDKKVEQDLWTLGFKNHIATLQEMARDKKNPRRTESQGLLSWCLEAASGFYLSLLQELCSTYELDLPFQKCGVVFGKLRSYTESTSIVPHSSSCLYICQYCLVHLGDIARYRSQRQQAENFYKHAILVSPNSGHPYNQLALLEASQGDKLSTVFQYVRGIAVKNPFPASVANLAKTLATQIDKEDPVENIQTKLSINEFISLFLRIHALLHTQTDLKQASICLKSINSTLTALVATESFTQDQLIMMTVINMNVFHHVGKEELTQDEKITWEMILALLAGSLSAFLLPVYTLKNDSSILNYNALPAIRLLLIWIKTRPELLKETEFATRLQIWPGYCKLLNNLVEHIDNKCNNEEYQHTPLSYDKELQGFVPLKEAYNNLKFKEEFSDKEIEKQMQALRLIELGKWLCEFDMKGSKLIISSKTNDKLHFEPGCIQPDPTDKLLEEMKSFKVYEPLDVIKLKDRKGGILKPQGSLEKSREERQVKIQEDNLALPKLDNAKMKRVTQNVALQSIYKKLEENKQVKFSPEATEKPQQKKSPLLPPPTNMQQYVMQSFNQNHPIMNPEKDFFNYAPPPQIPMPPSSNTKPPSQLENLHYPQKSTQEMNFSMPPPMLNMSNPNPNNLSMQNKSMFNNPMPPPSQMTFKPIRDQFPLPNFDQDDRGNNWWPSPSMQHNWRCNPMQPQPLTPQPQYAKDFYMCNQKYGQDMYNPWGNNNASHQGPGQASGHQLNMSNGQNPPGLYSSMNMRQAMLNESNKHLVPNTSMMNSNSSMMNSNSSMLNSNSSMMNSNSSMMNPNTSMMNSNSSMMNPNTSMMNNTQNNINNTPGYSLFNTTSWTPTLSQLRNNGDMQHQQSLFGAQPPQSLQQLLEQQNKLKGGDT